MRNSLSIFSQLLQPLRTVRFAVIVARHNADAYDKSFTSWAHLVALVFAQVEGVSSLRGLVSVFNAHGPMQRQLGVGPLHRATLADANHRRKEQVFGEVLARLALGLGRKLEAQGRSLVAILDATPIPLSSLCACAAWNGRIKGLKLHLVYDPACDRPEVLAITRATVNDVTPAQGLKLRRAATYVFDKGFCSFAWWRKIAEAEAFFVTRPKRVVRWTTLAMREVGAAQGEGFTVISDHEVALASKGDSRLPMRLRLITIGRDGKSKPMTLLTNDMHRSALAIASLYKQRWKIELLFRWLKQHLKLKRFLGRSENAIRLQILAALIAYVLIKRAALASRAGPDPLRLAELITACLFERRPLATLAAPPGKNRTKTKPIQCRSNHSHA